MLRPEVPSSRFKREVQKKRFGGDATTPPPPPPPPFFDHDPDTKLYSFYLIFSFPPFSSSKLPPDTMGLFDRQAARSSWLLLALVAAKILQIAFLLTERSEAFLFYSRSPTSRRCMSSSTHLHFSEPKIFIIDMDDDDDDDDEPNEEEEDEEEVEEDPYTKAAASEFQTSSSSSGSDRGELARLDDLSTNIDWGGALGSLRKRLNDVESGKSGDPSHALFRLMSAQSPNQAVGSFISTAKPQVVQAMSGAVGSLLGGLSNPASGVETIIKATGDKIGSLCFQLQMTGYVRSMRQIGSRLSILIL